MTDPASVLRRKVDDFIQKQITIFHHSRPLTELEPADFHARSGKPRALFKSVHVILVSIFTLVITASGMAQAYNQEPTMCELQRQLDEMHSQMVKMQNRIAELEAAKGIAGTSSSADPVQLQSETPPAQAFQFQPEKAKSPEVPTVIPLQGAYFDSRRFSGRNNACPHSQ
jgi:hypothetical protein